MCNNGLCFLCGDDDEVHFEKKKRYAIIMLSLSVCVLLQEVILLILILILILNITLRPRIANQMVMGSRCRGGIVHSRGGCSRARTRTAPSPKALWRFRVSTSNSLKWPFLAAYSHAHRSYLSYLRSTRYSSM